jgi:hypothetical protein
MVLVSFHKHRVFAEGSLSCLPPGSPRIVFPTKGKAFDILGISSRRVGGLFHDGALDYSVISPTGSPASKLCVARVDIQMPRVFSVGGLKAFLTRRQVNSSPEMAAPPNTSR